MSARLQSLVPLFAIAMVGLLCYGNTFNVPFLLDDVTSITGNPLVASFSFTLKPRILGDLSFALNYGLHGTALPGYHAVNLLLHIANGLLLYQLLLLTCSTPLFDGPGNGCFLKFKQPVALAAALLFISHPLQTQAVTYLAQRVALLAAFFCLAALAAYAGFRLSAGRRAGILLYALSLLLAFAGLLSKENAATLFLTLILYEVTFFRGGLVRRLLPPAGYLLPLLGALAVIMGKGGFSANLLAELGGLTAESGAPPRLTYLLTQFPVLVSYLRLFLLPLGQNLDHDVPLRSSVADPVVIASFLLLAAIAALGLFLWQKSRRGESASGLLALTSYGIGWFFITLLVESGLIPLRDVMFEHRLYLPSAGLVIIAAVGVWMLAFKWGDGDHGRVRRLFATAVAVVVILLGVATVQRNRVWQSEISIWKDAALKSPAKGRPHGSLGHALQRAGRPAEAQQFYLEAVRLSPVDYVARNNLGALYLAQKRYSSALGQFRGASGIAPDPFKLHYNTGLAYAGLGLLGDAENSYREALKLRPGSDQVYNNLGVTLARQGRLTEAAAAFGESVRLNPGNHEADGNLRAIRRARAASP